jgi:TPR repeat protein
MIRHLRVLAALGLLVGATPAWANRDAGVEAMQKGDYAKAAEEFQPLAEKGDMESQFDLATLYDTGKGVPQDLDKAFAWYERAARQGQKAAQFNLAVMYQDGIAVAKDPVQAYLYYSLALDGGPPYAARNRQQVRATMTPEQIATAEQLVLDFKPVIEH